MSEEVLQVVILGDGLLVGTEVFVPGTYTVGNSPNADLKLEDPAIGPEQALLYFQNGKVVVQNNPSTGGILVNGHKVSTCEIRPVDEISCGPYLLKTRILSRRHSSKPVNPEVAALLNGEPAPVNGSAGRGAQADHQPVLGPTPTVASSRREQDPGEAHSAAAPINGASAEAHPSPYKTMWSARQRMAASKSARRKAAKNGHPRGPQLPHLLLPTEKDIEPEIAAALPDPLRRARWLSLILLVLMTGWFGFSVVSVPRPSEPRRFSFRNFLGWVSEGTVGRPSGRGVSIQGNVDPDAVTKVVNAHLSEVRWCYKRALLQEPSLAGKVMLEWTTTVGGTVSNARVKSSTLHSASTETCILQSLTAWQFPPVKAVISYPLFFNSVGY